MLKAFTICCQTAHVAWQLLRSVHKPHRCYMPKQKAHIMISHPGKSPVYAPERLAEKTRATCANGHTSAPDTSVPMINCGQSCTRGTTSRIHALLSTGDSHVSLLCYSLPLSWRHYRTAEVLPVTCVSCNRVHSLAMYWKSIVPARNLDVAQASWDPSLP